MKPSADGTIIIDTGTEYAKVKRTDAEAEKLPVSDLDVATHIPALLTRYQRVIGTAKGLIHHYKNDPHTLFNIAMMGEATFIVAFRRTERSDSLGAGLTDAEVGRIYEHIKEYTQMLARKGAAFRRRKDWRG